MSEYKADDFDRGIQILNSMVGQVRANVQRQIDDLERSIQTYNTWVKQQNSTDTEEPK